MLFSLFIRPTGVRFAVIRCHYTMKCTNILLSTMQKYWVFRWMVNGVMLHSVKRENYILHCSPISNPRVLFQHYTAFTRKKKAKGKEPFLCLRGRSHTLELFVTRRHQ